MYSAELSIYSLDSFSWDNKILNNKSDTYMNILKVSTRPFFWKHYGKASNIKVEIKASKHGLAQTQVAGKSPISNIK